MRVHADELGYRLINAYSDETIRRQAREYGCDDYVTKPIDFIDLRE